MGSTSSRTRKTHRSSTPTAGIALPTRSLLVSQQDLDELLSGDELHLKLARQAVETLCAEGCSRVALAFLLVGIARKFPIALYPGWAEESTKSRRRRAQRDANILTKAADLIRSRYSFLIADTGGQSAEALDAYDKAMADSGLVSPNRLVRALEREIRLDRSSEDLVKQLELRPNQNARQVISRYVLCAYVERATGTPFDVEVAALLNVVGNHKNDPMALNQWRSHNMERFNRHFSGSVDTLFDLFHRKSVQEI